MSRSDKTCPEWLGSISTASTLSGCKLSRPQISCCSVHSLLGPRMCSLNVLERNTSHTTYKHSTSIAGLRAAAVTANRQVSQVSSLTTCGAKGGTSVDRWCAHRQVCVPTRAKNKTLKASLLTSLLHPHTVIATTTGRACSNFDRPQFRSRAASDPRN